jgi:ABC-type sugar transport system ATPase subunit
MANLRFESVTKSFGDVTAVDSVDLDVRDGEFVCLLGPSGCGKTTTLRLIAGLERTTRGIIRIGEEDVTRVGPANRDIGMVFQDYALYPHMTVLENIAYPLKVRGATTAARGERARQVARSLQIEHLLDRTPSQISGGQQQRTSVARAVVHSPRVFLFDEPLSNLDAKLRLEARAFLKRLQREVGVTAVYVTHDQAEAMAIADRIAVMDQGRIVQIGPPLEVYRKPRTTFVADFLGSPPMNLIPIRYREGKLEHTTFQLPAPNRTVDLRGLEGEALTLGVRPEHVILCGPDEPGSIAGEVFGLEPLGPETLVSLDVGGTLLVARIFADDPPVLDGTAHVRVAPDTVHLFGSDGVRID